GRRRRGTGASRGSAAPPPSGAGVRSRDAPGARSDARARPPRPPGRPASCRDGGAHLAAASDGQPGPEPPAPPAVGPEQAGAEIVARVAAELAGSRITRRLDQDLGLGAVEPAREGRALAVA